LRDSHGVPDVTASSWQEKMATKFCSVAHSAEFHNRQPGRKSKVKDAVEVTASKKCGTSVRKHCANSRVTLSPKNMVGAQQWRVGIRIAAGSEHGKFASVEEFRRECEWVLGKQA